MTITRLFQTGFEWGDLLLETPEVFRNVASNPTGIYASTTQHKTGDYCLEIDSRKSSGGTLITGSKYISIPYVTNTSQCRTSFHLMTKTFPAINAMPTFFEFAYQNTTTISLSYSYPNILLYAADVLIDTGISNSFNSPNTWSHISIDVNIHESDGWVRLYIDSELIIDYSGQTDHASVDIDRANYGAIRNTAWGYGFADNLFYDDIYIDDTTGEIAPTFAEDRRFRLIHANGNGSYDQWLGYDQESIDNYLHVDEFLTDQDSTYIYAALADITDGFRMTSFTLPIGWEISAIIPSILAKKDSSSGQIELEVGTRLDSINQLSVQQTLKTDYQAVQAYQPIKPGGGTWTQADLDVLEILIRTQGA